jgi:hypothetical protein
MQWLLKGQKAQLAICQLWYIIEQIMKKLKNGWVEGSVKDFLDLSDADVEYIKLRRALSRLLREARQKLHLTQVQVPRALGPANRALQKWKRQIPRFHPTYCFGRFSSSAWRGRNLLKPSDINRPRAIAVFING